MFGVSELLEPEVDQSDSEARCNTLTAFLEDLSSLVDDDDDVFLSLRDVAKGEGTHY